MNSQKRAWHLWGSPRWGPNPKESQALFARPSFFNTPLIQNLSLFYFPSPLVGEGRVRGNVKTKYLPHLAFGHLLPLWGEGNDFYIAILSHKIASALCSRRGVTNSTTVSKLRMKRSLVSKTGLETACERA